MSENADLSRLLAQMQTVRDQLVEASATAAANEVEGEAGQRAVVVRAKGEFDFTGVEIAPQLLGEADVSLVEDLVLAAVRDAVTRLVAARREALGSAAAGAMAELFSTVTDDEGTPPSLA